MRPEAPQWLCEAEVLRQLSDGSRLAPRDDQAVQSSQLVWEAHLTAIHADAPEGMQMLQKISLQRKDTDNHQHGSLYQPRSAINSASGIEDTCRPTMG